jgi:ribonuclease BN (tRNA processing enzyme)
VDHGGKSVVYATDTEHTKELDANVVKIASGVDVLIYDSQYTPEEYEGTSGKGGSKVGWGHSTFAAAVEIAKAARVKQLVLFHHDPLQSDEAVRAKEKRAKELFANSIAAYEGLTIDV